MKRSVSSSPAHNDNSHSTQAERDRWKRRVADRGRALKQANEINHTLTRVINEKLNH